MFCRAAAGELDVYAVFESDHVFAFLDHRPVFKGHVLVVPRAHVEVLADLPAAEVGPYFLDVQRIATAVEKGLGAAGSFVALNNRVSQSVPHLHTHVVPRTKGDGLRGFFWPRTKYASAEETAEYAKRITDAL
jgi:histidine triad (HIT) family protein